MTQPENYWEENLHDLSIEDILSWPNTPDRERYETTVAATALITHLSCEQAEETTRPDILKDIHHYTSILKEKEAAIEASKRITGTLAYVGDREITDVILEATAHMNSEATIGLAIALPVEETTMYRLVTLFAPVLAMSEYDTLLPMPSGQEPVD